MKNYYFNFGQHVYYCHNKRERHLFSHFLKDYASFPCRMRLLIIASET